jgi:hypothetical protein
MSSSSELHIGHRIVLDCAEVAMAKYLEHDYDLEHKPTGFIPHFHDTIDALGGYLGILLLLVGIIGFYWFVSFFIFYSRQRREAKKKK